MSKSTTADVKPGLDVEKKQYYDAAGYVFDEETNKCCAKEVHTVNGSDLYYIKMCVGEVLYHPTKFKLEKHLHHREMGRPYWNFKKVKKLTFDMYMSFLRTKNEIFYGNAQRSLT